MLRSLIFALGALAAALSPVEAASPEGGRITVQVQNVRSDDGHVLAVLHDKEDAFPSDGDRAVAKKKVKPANGRARASFTNVPPGTYAVTLIHDENDNGELDTNFLGMPREGVGTSNNPKARMGPPKWKDAKFEVEAGAKLTKKIQVQYLVDKK